MQEVKRLIMFNQMAGPLFRELAEDLSFKYEDGCLLLTGHPDTLDANLDKYPQLAIQATPAYNRSSNLGRAVSWVKYIVSISRYVIFSRKGDVILFVSNPPIIGPWVWFLPRFKPIPYGVLIYDIYPEVLIRLGVLKETNIIAKLWTRINKSVYKHSSLIVTLGNRMAEVIKTQLEHSPNEVSVVSPWVDVDLIKPLIKSNNPHADRFSKGRKFVVMYSGNMGESHDLESIVEAARLLDKEDHISFTLIGEGEKRNDIKAFIEKHDLKNVFLFPFQPEDMLPYTLPIADISIVTMDEGMEDLMVPSKTFFYLASGSALLGISNKGSEISDILESCKCGKLVPPRNPEALALSILDIISDPNELKEMKINARKLAEERYSRRLETQKISVLL